MTKHISNKYGISMWEVTIRDFSIKYRLNNDILYTFYIYYTHWALYQEHIH